MAGNGLAMSLACNEVRNCATRNKKSSVGDSRGSGLRTLPVKKDSESRSIRERKPLRTMKSRSHRQRQRPNKTPQATTQKRDPAEGKKPASGGGNRELGCL